MHDPSKDLISSSVLPLPVLLSTRALSHPSTPLYPIPNNIPHAHLPPSHSFPRLPRHHTPPPPPMHHILTWVGHRHKGNAQHKSVVQYATSTSQPKDESEKRKDVEVTATATGPCHVDLGSGDVSPLNSTSRSDDEDVSTCNGDAITGRYLLRLAPPYNRQTSFPGPYHSNCGASDANFSLSDLSGQHPSHLTTH
jgi:hypothetical protein